MKKTTQIIWTALFAGFVLLTVTTFGYHLLARDMVPQLADRLINLHMLVGLVTGGLFMMAIYSFALCLFRPKEHSAVYFALFCLANCVRFLLWDESIDIIVFQRVGGDPIFALRQLSIYLMLIGLMGFVFEIFEAGLSTGRKRMLILAPVALLLAEVNPFVKIPGLRYVTMLVGVAELGMMIWMIARSPVRKTRPIYTLYLCVLVLYLASFTTNALFFAPMGHLPILTNYTFGIVHVIVLSDRYARAIGAVEEANENLERIVAEQTAELRTANASLGHMNKLKSDLMETISHEARTPLAVLSSYAGLVSMELRDKGVDVQTADDLDKIVFEAKRVAGLIDSMKRMALHSEESGKRVALDIAPLMEQTARLYRPILERSHIALAVEAPENLPAIFGCPEELTQVFFNILQNAKNHTQSGSITVTIADSGEYIKVNVRDTGCGIPSELLPRIFEKGVSGGDGSGLGLFVSQEIVEAHGGTVQIESQPGCGTAVTILLPIYKEA